LSTSAEPVLFDTSAALALVSPDHPSHADLCRLSRGRPRGLSGHAAFEFLSVLTRLPRPQRLTGPEAHTLLTHDFPEGRCLPAGRMDALLAELVTPGITGGQVYDALVGACARHHGLDLLTCDARAEPTYRSLGVRYRLV